MNIDQAVQKRFRELCDIKSMSAQDLSTASHINIDIVNQILSGMVDEIPYHTIACLCNGLKIDLADFFQSDLFRNLK